MENKDTLPTESPECSETTPLVTKDEETSNNESSLSKLASDLSELTLKIGDTVAPTTPLEVVTLINPQDTAIQVPSSNSEGDDQSEASTDAEQSEIANAGETSEPIEPPTRTVSETESPQNSTPEPEVEGFCVWDSTMRWLLWQIILLGLPISATYYAVKYVRGCDAGEQLPLLLVAVAFITLLTLLARIIVNIARKLSCYNEDDTYPRKVIRLGDFITFALLVVEISYFFSIEKDRCDEELYAFVFILNYFVIGLFSVWLFCKCITLIRCIRQIQEE